MTAPLLIADVAAVFVMLAVVGAVLLTWGK